VGEHSFNPGFIAMKRVIIIGCGFGGLSAIEAFCKFRKKQDVMVIVIDKGLNSNFLPLLPDAIGSKINSRFLIYPIKDLSQRYSFGFINAPVSRVDLEEKKVYVLAQHFDYDYLIIASGSEANFYGNEQIKQYAYKLDDTEDAKVIQDTVEKKDFNSYLVAGGGYTGVEAATNLRRKLLKNSWRKRVIIIERAPSILGPLPQWMKAYVTKNLRKLNIEVLLNAVIDKVDKNSVYLASGAVFHDAMLIWAAGVKTSQYIEDLKIEKNPQGRLKVDEYLRLNDSCFVVGDAAYFSYKNSFLRMAVQFAIAEGECTAKNIINSIKGRQLKKYKPMDLGYIIPMANNLSCGKVFGLNLQGRVPTLLHYLMCLYRSFGFRNKFGIISNLLKGGEA
jgi:NADH dehydrogenase